MAEADTLPSLVDSDEPGFRLRAQVRYASALDDDTVDSLAAQADRLGLHGWVLTMPGGVEATLEGAASTLARFLRDWSRRLPAERRTDLLATFGPERRKFDRLRAFRDRESLERWRDAEVSESTSWPTTVLSRLRGRRASASAIEAVPAIGLREVVERNLRELARALEVDEDPLRRLVAETRGLSRERGNNRIARFLRERHGDRVADVLRDNGSSANAPATRRNLPGTVTVGDIPEPVAVVDEPGGSIDPCSLRVLLPAGPARLWPENHFPLFGTAVRPAELDPDGVSPDTYYLLERLRIDALLAELEIGQPLMRQWRELYATSARQPDLGTGIVEGHHDVWGIAGVIDENLAWLEPADVTLQSRYATLPSSFTLRRTGSKTMRELGNAWPELPLWSSDQNDLFHRLADLLVILRERRALVQMWRDDGSLYVIRQIEARARGGLMDGEVAVDLPTALGVGYNFEDPAVPQISDLYFTKIDADLWRGPGGTWSDFFQAEHAAMLAELDRVIPVVEEVRWQVGYHYLRRRTLSALKLLNEGHEALTHEQFQRAFNRYASAEALLTEIIERDLVPAGDPRRVTFRYSDPDTGADAEILLQRLLTVQNVLGPPPDISRDTLSGEFFLLLLVWLINRDDADLDARLRGIVQPDVKPILDGDFVTRPLEDALHYLRDFVIPACRGEAYLRRGEWDRRDYERALEQFERAGRYIPADGRDSAASHFLWLRMARTYLRKGYAEYAARDGSWAASYEDFGHVLDDSYGGGGEITVRELAPDGSWTVNPLVLALRIEACAHRRNISAGVNPLGFPANYVPAVRFNWISAQAQLGVQALDDAEQRYISFRVNAEDALQRFQQLSAAAEIAALDTFVAQANVSREDTALAAAQAAVTATQRRLDNARRALEEFSYLSSVRRVYSLFATSVESIVGAVAGGGVGLGAGVVNMATNDSFSSIQLEREVRELEDAVGLARGEVAVVTRTVATARALERLARLKEVVAQDALSFEAEREFNYARWFALADEMRDIVRYRLRSVLRLVYLSQQAFYFMTGIQVGIVVYDLNPGDTARNIAARLPLSSYLMGQHIRDALDALEAEWIGFYSAPGSSYQGRENCQAGSSALVEDVRLDLLDPLHFAALKQNRGGKIEFDVRLDQVDCRSEGSYLQLVEDVEVYGTFGNLGGQSVSAQLTNSPYSVVRLRDTADRITDGVTNDWVPSGSLGFKAVIKSQPLATQEFRGTLQQSPSFHTCAGPGSTPILSPFEYNGLAQRWTLEIKGSENPRLDFAQIVSLGVRFRFAQFRHGTSTTGLEALHAAECMVRPKGSVLLLALFDNFFAPGEPPFAADDLVATRQFLVDDFPMEHRNNPTLLNVGCLFVNKTGAPAFDPIHFHLTIDQYANEVAVDTAPVPEGQIALSDGSDPASQSPLSVFVDQDTTDAVVTPWLRLLTGTASAPVGATFTLRINLAENPTFDLANLESVLMHFEYRYS